MCGTIRLIALLTLSFFPTLAGAKAPDAGSPAVPQYHLKVGRQLSYIGTSVFTHQNGAFGDESKIQLTVSGQNADGSYRIIVRDATSHTQTNKNTSRPAAPPQERVEYRRLDVKPDGQVVNPEPNGDRVPAELPVVMPPLPIDAQQMSATWSKESLSSGQTDVFKSSTSPTASTWKFQSSTHGVFKDVYGMTTDRTYTFDIATGIITAVDMQLGQEYAFKGTGTNHIKLESDTQLSPELTQRLDADCGTFLAAQETMQSKLMHVAADTGPSKLKADLHASLSAARDQVTTPEIKAIISELLKSADREVEYTFDEAKRIASVVDKPLADVSVTDMKGQAHKLSEYKGKVLVLDFWYRGCGWCVLSMPQLKQIADDFKDQPFQLLGMNTDQKVDDAQYIIDAMKLNYPTARITFDTASQLQIQGYPSLLVVDRTGVVRVFHVGYTPHLKEDLEKKIRPLLSKTASR